MNAQRMLHREAPQRLGDDALAFLHRQFLKCFVFQASDLLALVVIPHPAFEAGVAAGAEI